jgi:hypothetical protein
MREKCVNHKQTAAFSTHITFIKWKTRELNTTATSKDYGIRAHTNSTDKPLQIKKS